MGRADIMSCWKVTASSNIMHTLVQIQDRVQWVLFVYRLGLPS